MSDPAAATEKECTLHASKCTPRAGRRSNEVSRSVSRSALSEPACQGSSGVWTRVRCMRRVLRIPGAIGVDGSVR
ncbi:Uncharacterised protein [Mycobacteroides abscessus subsp. abscessus]|nr:Uncharacterised protein [Mycobacteroides abscessus subsp. abscessus]